MAGQAWAPVADGGYFANPQLSKKLRFAAQPFMKLRQMVRPEPAFGKNKGDQVDLNKLSNVQTAGRKIGETERLPETKYLIRRTSTSIAEFGNSVPYTGKLENLSMFNVTQPIQKVLRDDQIKVMDGEVATELKTTKMKYTPTSLVAGTFVTDSATQTQTATENFKVFHLKEIVDRAIVDYVPPATGGPDGEYILVGTRKLIRSLFDDPDFQEWQKYTTGAPLIKGEVGKLYRTRIVETNSSSSFSIAGVPSSTKVCGEGLFFGDDAIVEAVAVPEELRAAIPSDFGRSKSVAWYALLGFKLLWDPTVDTSDNVTGGEWRVLHIGSTA